MPKSVSKTLRKKRRAKVIRIAQEEKRRVNKKADVNHRTKSYQQNTPAQEVKRPAKINNKPGPMKKAWKWIVG